MTKIVCPECGHGTIYVDAVRSVTVRVDDDGVEITDEFDTEFDSSSFAYCAECDTTGTYGDFTK